MEALARALAPADDTPRDVAGSILLNLAVFVAYSISGLVVLVFGIGPAKISPIYPPAGIAVAASFIFGPRVLPAIFFGQFLNGFPLLAEPQMTLARFVLANTAAVSQQCWKRRYRSPCCGNLPARGIRSSTRAMS